MLYKNNSPEALYEMELQRTGNFGEDDEECVEFINCDICGRYEQDIFFADGRRICSRCICDNIRSAMLFEDLPEANRDIAENILYEIASDISDSDILAYAERLFDKIN